MALSEAAGDLLLDLTHSQVTLGAVVGERHVRLLGEEQDGALVLFEALPEVVGVGFGDSAALAVLLCRDGR